jgi:nucleoside-diphosphate-sugar epimerase
MRVAVIGGTGFIGRETVARLAARGAEVLVIHRGQTQAPLSEGVRTAEADRMDGEALAAILDDFRPETVIDVLAMTEAGTLPVLRAVSERAERYVLVSSADVYGNYGGLIGKEHETPITRPLREDDPLREVRYPYRGNAPAGAEGNAAFFDQYDKIVVEALARSELNLETTVLRLPMVFGPGDRQHRFGWMVKAVRAGGRAALDERAAAWRSTHGYVTDVAEGIALAATDARAHGKTYNLGRSDAPSMAQWLAKVAAELGVTLGIETVPAERRGLLADFADGLHMEYPLMLDTGRIRSELEYADVVSEDEALRRTTAWEEEGH